MNNVLQETLKQFTVKGQGNTKQEAVEKGFLQLRDLAVKEITNPIVYMAPNQVEIVSFQEVEQTEAFLYLFFKRTKKTYEVTMNVEVLIKYIPL